MACALACAAALVHAAGAFAQTYPAKPVKLVVGASTGGPSDFLGRLFADAVGGALGQSVIVENKAGASGTIAAEAVSKAAPDGHTLLVAGPSSMTVAPYLFPKLGYEPAKDFTPFAMLGAGAFVLAVHPSLPVRSVQELIALARSKPGSLSFGSGGNGSSAHLVTETFSGQAGIRLLHVPYKGDGQAVTDLIGGQIQLMFTAPNVAVSHAKAGRLRLLAVTTRERLATMPEVPTVAESGPKDFEYLGWIVAFAPAGTPKVQLEALGAAWNKARAQGPVKTRLEELGMLPPERISSIDALDAFLKAENQRLGKVIRDAGIRPE